jgi:uncharacterized protein (TIGR02453 family)
VTAFGGFPPAALTFFEGLEADNSKSYWTANKDVYESAVRDPMVALCSSVGEEFRPLRMFRPNRDVRFAKDKSPYKTAAAAAGERDGGTTYYVQLSTAGLFVGAGYHHMAADQLERFRAGVDDGRLGPELADAVAVVRRAKLEIGSHDALKTAPRGYAKDHPRIDLLRLKGLHAGRQFPPARWLATPACAARVEETWRVAEPVLGWLDAHVGPSTLPPPEPR